MDILIYNLKIIIPDIKNVVLEYFDEYFFFLSYVLNSKIARQNFPVGKLDYKLRCPTLHYYELLAFRVEIEVERV